MTPEYEQFLLSKTPAPLSMGFEPMGMPDHLFDFQQAAVNFCIRKGRAALFLDTGLGKTACELEFARQAAAASNGYALILTPLAVAKQTEREGIRFGYDCRVVRDADDVRPGINICNYDRLDKLDADIFGCVILDESSILKNFTGKTTRALISTFADTPFRLVASATPSPNDHTELGTQAEFLGIMDYDEMLIRWFINDTANTGNWRLKGHAVTPFWDWVTSWAIMASNPEDLGFDGSRFVLPPMEVIRHKAIGTTIKPEEGSLFAGDVSATNMHEVKRQTAQRRADIVADLVAAEPDQAWLLWVDADYEADAVMARIPDATEVRGSHTPERKEIALENFALGTSRILVTKPGIAGAGMNFQICARMVFVGRSFSYESWYQAVRRCWRFGQKRNLIVHLIVADGEDQIGRVIDRKADDHAIMREAMRSAARRNIGSVSQVKIGYNPIHQGRLPSWLTA